ncbi:MAG: hypothetical protein L0Y44_10375 [Phycisphaerales bacterium]|nr:hypothetical protein [Phycisphaerales bacterium]MCI0675745.1 hypothetical protein [Phycisphaerales bacterium]
MLLGCSADQPLNPSFPLKVVDAKRAIDDMKRSPGALERPMVVVGGILDPGDGAESLAAALAETCGGERKVISVCFCGVYDFDRCAQRLVEAVEKAFPGGEPDQTIEVDVVATSMGGLIARHAANMPSELAAKRPRLNIARLFTISTPHRGASLAVTPTIDRRVVDMRAGSDFLNRINVGFPPTYEVVAYVCVPDYVIGERNAALMGQTPWWVASAPFTSSHLCANDDPRIIADIARRLRGEQPFTTDPPSPLPRRGLFRPQAGVEARR